jgi:hypothetical protein
MSDLTARFIAVLRPSRRPAKTKIDDADYAAFMMRAIRAWEARVIDNPEMITANEAMAARFSEITAVAIAANAEWYAIDPRLGASMSECARILGISKPSASERRKRGKTIMETRIAAAGVARFSEAARERHALEVAAANAADELADFRHRRAAAEAAAAGTADELAAYRARHSAAS